jgi:hypothetical protein
MFPGHVQGWVDDCLNLKNNQLLVPGAIGVDYYTLPGMLVYWSIEQESRIDVACMV